MIRDFKVRLDDDRMPYLVKGDYVPTIDGLVCAESVNEFLTYYYDAHKLPEEHSWVICTNVKLDPIAVFEIGVGSANECNMGAREIYMRALLAGANFIFLAHNHPSGDCTPSTKDIQVTETIERAGELIGVPLKDHIILGNGKYFSFKTEGYIL